MVSLQFDFLFLQIANGSESRIFFTKPIPSDDKSETDESNKIDHPYLQSLSRKKEVYLNAQVPKDKPTAAKNMIRTDPKQQKLDLFINVSKTNDSNRPEKSMDKMPSK